MNNFLILISLISVVLSSCSTPPEPLIQYVDPVPEIINVSGNHVNPSDLGNLRYSEDVKGFTYNRYIDPHDASIMYEQGIMYRQEQNSAWNLQPNLHVKVPFDGTPRQTISDDTKLVNLELALYAQDQKKAAKWLKIVKEETVKSLDKTKNSLRIAKRINDQNLKLEAQIEAIKKQNDALKLKIKKSEETAKKIVKYYEIKEKKRLEDAQKNKYRRN